MYLIKSTQFLKLFFILSLLSCTKKEKKFDLGKVENNLYTNSFFETKIKLPEGWVVQSKESIKTISEVGKNIFIGENEKLRTIVDASEVNSATLLSVFKNPIGANVKYNHNFMLIIENIVTKPEINSAYEYLEMNKKLMKEAQIKYGNLDEKCKETTIGNKTFFTFNPSLNYAGVDFSQKYYSTIINDFVFTMIISYCGEEQKKELEKIIDSVEFY